MFEAFGLGFSYGIGLSLMLGTVFFALIKFGLSNGYKAGLAIAAGVIASDILFILLAFGLQTGQMNLFKRTSSGCCYLEEFLYCSLG